MMTPVQQAPPRRERDPGRDFLRSLIAMLGIGGLLVAGIMFYIRASDSNFKVREQASNQLEALGREIWRSRGMANLNTATEEQKKDLDDLPRIFNAGHALATQKGTTPIISVIEGDPPPGRGNATHQIHYFFNDTLNIILHVYVDAKTGDILFVDVHNRLVPDRSLQEENKAAIPNTAGTPAESAPPPATLPGSGTGLTPGEPPALPGTDSPKAPVPTPSPVPSGEKVSEPPAIPR